MTSLTDIELDLHDAEQHAANLRAVLREARRRGISLPATDALLVTTERQIARLDDVRRAMRAAVDKLCATITRRACCGWPHDHEERRLFALLGCEPLDEERWPYVGAALRAREEPTVDTMTAFFRTRQVLLLRRVA